MSLFRQRGDDRQRPGEQDKKQIEKNVKPVFARLCLVAPRSAFYMVILPTAQEKKRGRPIQAGSQTASLLMASQASVVRLF